MGEERGYPLALIESAGPAEFEAVMAFAALCPEAPLWPRDAWSSFLPEKAADGAVRRKIFLARSAEGRILGLIAVALTLGTTDLELLLVHPQMRRQGIGRQLAIYWLAWAQAAGAEVALLEVRASNDGAQTLYRALAFERQGTRKHYYQHPDEDAVLMTKPLAEACLHPAPSVPAG